MLAQNWRLAGGGGGGGSVCVCVCGGVILLLLLVDVLCCVLGAFLLLKCLSTSQRWQRDCLPYRSMSCHTDLYYSKNTPAFCTEVLSCHIHPCYSTTRLSQSGLNNRDCAGTRGAFFRTVVNVLRDCIERQQLLLLKHVCAVY